jgi:hypothetical protein
MKGFLAVLLGMSILNFCVVPGFGAEPATARPSLQHERAGHSPSTTPSPDSCTVDFRSAAASAVAGVLREERRADPAGFFESAPAGSLNETAQGAGATRTADSPVIVNKTSRRQKITAFVALAAAGAVTTVLAIRAVRHDDPKLTPGTPTRVSP